MKQVGDIIPVRVKDRDQLAYYRITEVNEDGVKMEPCTKKEALDQMVDLAERRQLSEVCGKSLQFKVDWV